MASTRFNYEIGFNINTYQVQRAIGEVNKALSQIGNNATTKGLTAPIIEATTAAKDLQHFMLSAVDQVTGKLDVSKFQQSIKDSGLSLQDYAIRLQKLGPEGEQAFIKIANAVALAEAPTKRLSNFWTKLWSTFGNTVRWQFTTGLLHTFTGQLSSAYRYAQDLDESLNNIRIVTGKSAEEMAKFAQQANNAAKTLSTTTTDYTNASLIYYQQGKIFVV